MNIVKKTLMAGMAVAAVTGASATIGATEAEAHYRYYGHHHHYKKHYYKRHYYKRHYVKCYWKKVWRTDYYGYRYLKKIKVCH